MFHWIYWIQWPKYLSSKHKVRTCNLFCNRPWRYHRTNKIHVKSSHVSVIYQFHGTQVEFFLNGVELLLNSANSGNLLNYWGMNWAQIKHPVSRGLRVLLAGSSPFTVILFLTLNSVKHLGKTPLCSLSKVEVPIRPVVDTNCNESWSIEFGSR